MGAPQRGRLLGLDFGTTNTVAALASTDGELEILRFPTPAGPAAPAFRSVLAFQAQAEPEAGPWAIEAFLDDPADTRLIQSFKSFAASSAFAGTSIFGRRFQFEDLLSLFFRQLRRHCAEQQIDLPDRAVIGRPVVFAGADPDEGLALQRYAAAFDRAGIVERSFAYEPVGAAYFFARRLQAQATVLVADFGGGTSDFSIMRFAREGTALKATPLSRTGVGVAGDTFDFRIIDNVISPRLGKGSTYGSGGKTFPVPSRYYAAFARWNQLALMKGSKELRDIRQLARTASDPDAVQRFISIIEEDHGYALYRAVSSAKEALSAHASADLAFVTDKVDIQVEVRRSDFEQWIAAELDAMGQAVDAAVAEAGLGPADIDKVFLTGGTSFVPAVRALFTDRFGSAAIETGGEFESIAGGLALLGADQAGLRAPA